MASKFVLFCFLATCVAAAQAAPPQALVDMEATTTSSADTETTTHEEYDDDYETTIHPDGPSAFERALDLLTFWNSDKKLSDVDSVSNSTAGVVYEDEAVTTSSNMSSATQMSMTTMVPMDDAMDIDLVVGTVTKTNLMAMPDVCKSYVTMA